MRVPGLGLLLSVASILGPASPGAVAADPLRSPEDLFAEKVQAATDKAVAFLAGKQLRPDFETFNWEDREIAYLPKGGVSALVLLALLEAGEKPDDPVVASGLAYLRTLTPNHTYTVSLVTEALCAANQRRDARLIRENVEWLGKAADRPKGNLRGWGFGPGNAVPDFLSPTRFAATALHRAHKAGFPVQTKGFWESVRDLYLTRQRPDGSWRGDGRDPFDAGPNHMALAGALGLRLARDVLGGADEFTDRRIALADGWLGENHRIPQPVRTFQGLSTIGAYGRVSGEKHFGPRRHKKDWYRLGCSWLLANQHADGSFKGGAGLDSFEVVSTAFAVRFLAGRPEAE